MFIIPAVFKIIEFAHRFARQFNQMQTSLKEAEHQIIQLRETIGDLRTQMEDHNRVIQEQMNATMDIQRQLIDQSVDAIDASKQIEEVYECLDLLDDRLLELAKSERTGKIKKQVRKEINDKTLRELQKQKQEIEALDRKLPNEEKFDQFVADVLVSDPAGQIGRSELWRLFREWRENIRTYISNEELEEYMSLNFDYSRGAWTGIKSNVSV